MKRPQLIGIAIAALCGLGAFFGVMRLIHHKPTVVRDEVVTDTIQVLVARYDLGIGQVTGAESLRWQDWPKGSVTSAYVQRNARPSALNEFTGAIARTPIAAGEPITWGKLVKAGDGGVLAAILPAGMRAASTRIKEETSAGRLILPNDRVDVILTRRQKARGGGDEHTSNTIFRNVRVLAIGQLIEATKGGKRLAEGNTATLELTPRQSEELAAANARGEISLSLRSIEDWKPSDEPMAREPSDSVQVLRYGVRTRAFGAN